MAGGVRQLGIAFFEYWLAVPANRIGGDIYSPAQLKAAFATFALNILRQHSGKGSIKTKIK